MNINISKLSSSDKIGSKRDRISDHFYKELSIIQSASNTPCRFRFYCSGSVIHCIAWISGREVYGSGYGKAGGYGYCKESAAMQDAINNAGITMSERIDGRGDSLMRSAALGIAKAVTGKRKFHLHIAHG